MPPRLRIDVFQEGTATDLTMEGDRVKSQPSRAISLLIFVVALVALLPGFGCTGTMAQLIYVFKGHKVPKEYEGLKDQRVALLVISDGSGYGPDYSMQVLEQLMQRHLELEYKKKIDLIPQDEVYEAFNGRVRDPDYVAVGRSLKADKVVVIEITDYQLREGATLYKGNCYYKCAVFDTAEGHMVFSRGPNSFSYPTDGQPSIETSERDFEQMFLAELSFRVARYFCDQEVKEMYSRDAIAFQ